MHLLKFLSLLQSLLSEESLLVFILQKKLESSELLTPNLF